MLVHLIEYSDCEIKAIIGCYKLVFIELSEYLSRSQQINQILLLHLLLGTHFDCWLCHLFLLVSCWLNWLRWCLSLTFYLWLRLAWRGFIFFLHFYSLHKITLTFCSARHFLKNYSGLFSYREEA